MLLRLLRPIPQRTQPSQTDSVWQGTGFDRSALMLISQDGMCRTTCAEDKETLETICKIAQKCKKHQNMMNNISHALALIQTTSYSVLGHPLFNQLVQYLSETISHCSMINSFGREQPRTIKTTLLEFKLARHLHSQHRSHTQRTALLLDVHLGSAQVIEDWEKRSGVTLYNLLSEPGLSQYWSTPGLIHWYRVACTAGIFHEISPRINLYSTCFYSNRSELT